MGTGENIKRRRHELDMTLEDVASQMGISRQTLSRYETGVICNIPSDRIEKLAQILKTTPAYLMGWDEMYNGDMDRANATYHYIHDTMPEEARRRKEMMDNAPNGLSYKVKGYLFGVKAVFNCQTIDIQDVIGDICKAILAIQTSWDVDGLNTLEALAQAFPKLNRDGLIRLSEYVKMLSSQDDYTKEDH